MIKVFNAIVFVEYLSFGCKDKENWRIEELKN